MYSFLARVSATYEFAVARSASLFAAPMSRFMSSCEFSQFISPAGIELGLMGARREAMARSAACSASSAAPGADASSTGADA
jgi:hypothetical protein